MLVRSWPPIADDAAWGLSKSAFQPLASVTQVVIHHLFCLLVIPRFDRIQDFAVERNRTYVFAWVSVGQADRT